MSTTPKLEVSDYDVIGYIADIQTSYTDNFKKLRSDTGWKLLDARLQVFFNCLEVAANARLSIGLLASAKAGGLREKDWWAKWTSYDKDRAFVNCPDFGTFVEDKSRQFIHRVQEQLLISVQIYTEAFLRELGRQFQIDRTQFWQLKKDLLQDLLGFGPQDVEPLTVYQHLRNSLHNKGLHHNSNYPDLAFEINGYSFSFAHGQMVKISWEHIRELQIAISNLLLRINKHAKVSSLPAFDEKNIVVLSDD